MPLVVVSRPLSSLCQERYQLRATTSIPSLPSPHVYDRPTDPLLYTLVDGMFLNLLELQFQYPIRANVHLSIMRSDDLPVILVQVQLNIRPHRP